MRVDLLRRPRLLADLALAALGPVVIVAADRPVSPGYPATRSGVCLAQHVEVVVAVEQGRPWRMATTAIRQSVSLRTVSPPARQRRWSSAAAS